MSRTLTSLIVTSLCVTLFACGKGGDDGPDVDPKLPPVDPETAKTIGFFMDDWQSRTFNVPSSTKDTTISDAPQVTISIDPYGIKTRIPASVFGESANLTTTQFVTEAGLMNNINTLDPAYIRFPGGDNGSLYFWNASEGNLPADVPSTLVDKDGATYTPKYSVGNSSAANTLSLSNYYNLLQQTGSKGIIAVNYSYARYSTADNPVQAAAHLAADWVRYDNGRTKYWEVGNENYGNWQAGFRIKTAANKDGQPEIITGDVYGDHVSVIIDSMRKAATETGKPILISAVLVEGIYTSTTPTERDWNAKVIGKVHSKVDFYSLHNFYTPFGKNSDAAYILYSPANSTKLMADYINNGFKSANVEAKPLAMTAYGINAVSAQQQSSFVNGMHAVATISEVLNNKVGMAGRQTLVASWSGGNSPGVFSYGDEPSGVAKWSPRPAFYYSYFFRHFLGDRAITTTQDKASELLAYASSFSSKHIGLTILNKADVATVVKVDLKYWQPGTKVYWYSFAGGNDNGQFSQRVFINGNGPSGNAGGPSNYQSIPAYSASTDGGILIPVPRRGTVMLAFSYTQPK